jgi:predicted alpha/beta-fold hydrolase
VHWKAQVLREMLDWESAITARTIRQFDDLVTAPLHGFENASDYYSQASSIRYLEGIGVPTLLLHAADDPFLPEDSIPEQEAKGNRNLHLALQRRGGHVGFLAGTPRQPSFWAEEEGARFLAEALESRPSAELETPGRGPTRRQL